MSLKWTIHSLLVYLWFHIIVGQIMTHIDRERNLVEIVWISSGPSSKTCLMSLITFEIDLIFKFSATHVASLNLAANCKSTFHELVSCQYHERKLHSLSHEIKRISKIWVFKKHDCIEKDVYKIAQDFISLFVWSQSQNAQNAQLKFSNTISPNTVCTGRSAEFATRGVFPTSLSFWRAYSTAKFRNLLRCNSWSWNAVLNVVKIKLTCHCGGDISEFSHFRDGRFASTYSNSR